MAKQTVAQKAWANTVKVQSSKKTEHSAKAQEILARVETFSKTSDTPRMRITEYLAPGVIKDLEAEGLTVTHQRSGRGEVPGWVLSWEQK